MLSIVENNSSISSDFFTRILCGVKDETREAVAEALRANFAGPVIEVYVGGHHVALVNARSQKRLLLVTGTSPDFSVRQPHEMALRNRYSLAPNRTYAATLIGRNISHDMKRRYQLCKMIEIGREIRVLAMKMDGMPMCDDPARFVTTVDQLQGSKYSYIVYQGRRIFAVEHDTSRIFSVSQSGRVNRDRSYGTLDTLEDWNWGYMKPQLRPGRPHANLPR